MPLFTRIALGLMTVWAVVYAFAALRMDLGVAREGVSFFGPEIQAVSVLDALAIFCVYAWRALRSPRMRAIDKTGSVFAMLFLYPIVVPLFWYPHVWRAAPPMRSPANAGGAP